MHKKSFFKLIFIRLFFYNYSYSLFINGLYKFSCDLIVGFFPVRNTKIKHGIKVVFRLFISS